MWPSRIVKSLCLYGRYSGIYKGEGGGGGGGGHFTKSNKIDEL